MTWKILLSSKPTFYHVWFATRCCGIWRYGGGGKVKQWQWKTKIQGKGKFGCEITVRNECKTLVLLWTMSHTINPAYSRRVSTLAAFATRFWRILCLIQTVNTTLKWCGFFVVHCPTCWDRLMYIFVAKRQSLLLKTADKPSKTVSCWEDGCQQE